MTLERDTRRTLGKIKRTNGVAGQVSYAVTVTYAGEPAELVTFVGNVYGGPILMLSHGHQTWVADPGRQGVEFSPEWVRRFFA